jgi:hypothetical protein
MDDLFLYGFYATDKLVAQMLTFLSFGAVFLDALRSSTRLWPVPP